MKYAVLTMDIEDWYHLDYLRNRKCDQTYSMLDGISKYKEIIDFYEIPSTFFVVGDVMLHNPELVRRIHEQGHEIGCHGWSHRPLWALAPELCCPSSAGRRHDFPSHRRRPGRVVGGLLGA
jgi:hypothetical protein